MHIIEMLIADKRLEKYLTCALYSTFHFIIASNVEKAQYSDIHFISVPFVSLVWHMLHLLVSDCVSYQEFNLLQTDRINQITFETSKNISTVNAKGQYSIVNG